MNLAALIWGLLTYRGRPHSFLAKKQEMDPAIISEKPCL